MRTATNSFRVIFFIVAMILFLQSLAVEVSYAQVTSMTTEDILFRPIETIISASKREQRIQDSPSTISVITEEDIKESGANSIPDLLKYIPGLDVMEITSSHWEINARGLNDLRSNKMLVMIDQRSVYLDYFGGVIWESLPVHLADIKRIEIIRGPVSAIYGANAFSGIINIITKSPRDSEGLHFSGSGGNLGDKRASMIYGNRSGKLAYKISGHVRSVNSWRDAGIVSEERKSGKFKMEYLLNPNSTLSFDAGIEDGTIEQIILSSILKFDGLTNYAKLNYNYKDTKIQAFWNHGDIESPSYVNYGGNVYQKYNTFDTEIQRSFELGTNNRITLEANYRINTTESNINDKNHRQNLFAGLFQDEFKPLDNLTFHFGARMDNHPLVDNNISPRGSIIYEPVENHTFRVSAGQAYRNPTFTDSYAYIPLDPDLLGLPPLPPETKIGLTVVGNVDLKPEKIQTFELGYQTIINQRARLKVDLFYNKITDFIGSSDTTIVSFFEVPFIGIRIPTEITQQRENSGNAEAYGAEFDVDFLVKSWMRLRGNYSFVKFQNRYTLNRRQAPPENKFNIIGDFAFNNGFSFNLRGHFVDRALWDIDTDNDNIPEERVTKSYFTFDSRIAYAIRNTGLSLVFSGQNIFDNKHREYPVGEKIGRRLSFRLNYNF